MKQTITEFVLNNYRDKPIKELAREFGSTPQEITKIFREHKLESPFLCSKFSINHYYSDISYTCFKIAVEAVLEYGLENPDHIFILATLDYCFDTSHDIKEAIEFFKEYYYKTLVPQLHNLKDPEMIIGRDLVSLLIKNANKEKKSK